MIVYELRCDTCDRWINDSPISPADARKRAREAEETFHSIYKRGGKELCYDCMKKFEGKRH